MSDGNTEGTLRQKLRAIATSEVEWDSVETTRQRLLQTTKAYILGVIHDATERKTTFRIAQKYKAYPLFIKKLLSKVGKRAWVYKEGKERKVYIVEFSKSFLKGFKIASDEEKRFYVRGYFDAEGGVARKSGVRFYIYFAQKDRQDLEKVWNFLKDFGIACGVIHNPSRKADPDYWRFFVRARSYKDFAKKIGSWHPIKSRLLRMKI